MPDKSRQDPAVFQSSPSEMQDEAFGAQSNDSQEELDLEINPSLNLVFFLLSKLRLILSFNKTPIRECTILTIY
jgi:hypothetical protein